MATTNGKKRGGKPGNKNAAGGKGRSKPRSHGSLKEQTAAAQAYCKAVSAHRAKEHAEHVHHTRIKLAFERLQREYPMVALHKLWSMAQSSLRAAAASVHAHYTEPKVIAE